MSTRLSPTGRYPGPGGFGDAIPMRRPGGARRRGWAGFLARLLAGERPEIAGALCVDQDDLIANLYFQCPT